MLAMLQEQIKQAAEDGRLRNGHTRGAKVHAVIADHDQLGTRRTAICGRVVHVVAGGPMFGCERCQAALRIAGVSRWSARPRPGGEIL